MTGQQAAEMLARAAIAQVSVSEPSTREVQIVADAIIREGVRVAQELHGTEMVA